MQAGSKRSDVRYSNRLMAPGEWLAGLRNKAVDALEAVEPVATQIVDQGFGVALTWSPTRRPLVPEILLSRASTTTLPAIGLPALGSL